MRRRVGEEREAHLFFNDLLINLSCGNIMVARQSYIQIAFVISEIEVDFPTIIEDINLT